MLVPEEISILASSNPAAGAKNLSANGDRFEIQFDEALQIPKDALDVNISVEESTIWWVIPNIITGVNDKFYITGPDTVDVVQNYVVTLPQGLYDDSLLNKSVLTELANQGAKQSPSPLINFVPDQATQKIQIRFNYTTVIVDFTQPYTFREIIGFDANVYGPYAIVPATILAENVAAFNQVNSFLIHSDLTNQGIRFNNTYNQSIAQVLIDVLPGSQITSQPYNPPKISAQDLVGTSRSNIRFWLTDDQNRGVNTNTEYWTARIVIRYLRPFTISKQ